MTEVTIKWTGFDVQRLHPDWTPQQCDDALKQIANDLKAQSINTGWGVLEKTRRSKWLKRLTLAR